MEIELSPELQAKLDRICLTAGTRQQVSGAEAVARLVGYDEWTFRQVETGLAQVAGGETLEHKDVVAHTQSLIAKKRRRT